MEPLLRVTDLKAYYKTEAYGVSRTVRAVDGQGKNATFTDLGPQVKDASGAVGLRFNSADFH